MTSVTQAARAAAQLRQAALDVARVAASRSLAQTEKVDGNAAGMLTHSDGHTIERVDGSAQSDCQRLEEAVASADRPTKQLPAGIRSGMREE
jgi:hypothetical protein